MLGPRRSHLSRPESPILRVTLTHSPPVLEWITEVSNAAHEQGSSNSAVAPLLFQMLIVLLEMLIQVPFERLIPNEPLPAYAALELDALIHLSDCEHVEPISSQIGQFFTI